jgi:hypothetical protein
VHHGLSCEVYVVCVLSFALTVKLLCCWFVGLLVGVRRAMSTRVSSKPAIFTRRAPLKKISSARLSLASPPQFPTHLLKHNHRRHRLMQQIRVVPIYYASHFIQTNTNQNARFYKIHRHSCRCTDPRRCLPSS